MKLISVRLYIIAGILALITAGLLFNVSPKNRIDLPVIQERNVAAETAPRTLPTNEDFMAPVAADHSVAPEAPKAPVAPAASAAPPEPEPPAPPAPLAVEVPLTKDALFWLWAGAGMSYTEFSQKIGTNSVQYGGFKSPSLAFKGGSMISEKIGVQFSYHETPGEVASGGTITANQSSFKWRVLEAELLAKPKPQGPWQFHLGIQQHEFPFTLPIATNQVAFYKMGTTSASVGVQYTRASFRNLRHEIKMRYQHPISAQAPTGLGFSSDPQFAFDGSLGQVYSATENLRLGIFWHGQWHEFDFSASNSSGSYLGTQKIFNSTLDVRIGWEY